MPFGTVPFDAAAEEFDVPLPAEVMAGQVRNDDGAHDGAHQDESAPGRWSGYDGAHDGAHQDESAPGRWSGYEANLVTLEIPSSAVAGESLVVPSELSGTGYVEVTRCDEIDEMRISGGL